MWAVACRAVHFAPPGLFAGVVGGGVVVARLHLGFDELWLARLQAQPWKRTLPLVAEQGHLEAHPTPLCIESPAARSRDIPEVCGRDLRACCSRGIIRCRARPQQDGVLFCTFSLPAPRAWDDSGAI